MTTQNNLDARWEALHGDSFNAVFQLYDAIHPLDFYIGKSQNGHRLLLILCAEAPPVLRDMRAVRIQTFKRDDGKWSLLLTLEKEQLAPMFSLLCADLIESSRNLPTDMAGQLNFVLKRLANWRRLLERGTPALLSEAEIRGLCGELLFLRTLCTVIGDSAAVDSWVGSLNADQDFQTPTQAWEIKTIRPSSITVTISSAVQLQTDLRSVQLVVYELADSTSNLPDSFSLPDLVEQMRLVLAADFDAEQVFEERLAAAGYMPHVEYASYQLVCLAISAYQIRDDFPRITPAHVSPAISAVQYDLLLDQCSQYRIDSPTLKTA